MYIQKGKKASNNYRHLKAMKDIIIIFNDSKQVETNLISPAK